MPLHLFLPDPRTVQSRRQGGGGGAPAGRKRQQHGAHLENELQQITAAPRRLDRGVDPALVFKLRATGRPSDNALEGRGLRLLGETADYTYFVLSDDAGMDLAAALRDYQVTGSLSSLLDLINDIEPYGPADRRGPGLTLPSVPEPYLVDITIWPSPDHAEARRRAIIVEQVLARRGGEVQLRFLSARRNLIRARVSEAGLDDLLDTSVIEQVRTPPVPFMDFREWRTLGATDLNRTTMPSATVGVLDDAPATQHPLLAGLVESVDFIGPAEYGWQQRGDHGSEVVGRVLLPNLLEELRDGEPITAYGTVRVARILEPQPDDQRGAPRFAQSAFPHDLVEQGIRHLHGTYGVKIFNLSVGYDEPYSDVHLGALTETIDDLVRELKIVVVVPTGNTAIHVTSALTPSGHHVADDYPAYLDAMEHRLAEPAPAALALTVGSLALSAGVAELSNRFGWRAVAGVDQPSPFSRTGPGIGTSSKRRNKPDLVHYGGNVVVTDSNLVAPNELGASMVSTAVNPETGQLFQACNGTSYAAPAVARVAADVLHAYPDASANLIRALVAISAKLPSAAADTQQDDRCAARFGLGRPDSGRAVTSGRQRATMTYDGAMTVDTVRLHPVPVPEVFRRGSGGERTITVALAFDPPVRRQRREYLAATMQVALYRNVDPDELQDMLSRQDPDNPKDLINDRRRRPPLEPGSTAVASSTLQVRSWTARNSFTNDDETFYVAVTHRAATWTRNDSAYLEQTYALTVTLEDQNLAKADLHQLLTQQVKVPARIRIRR